MQNYTNNYAFRDYYNNISAQTNTQGAGIQNNAFSTHRLLGNVSNTFETSRKQEVKKTKKKSLLVAATLAIATLLTLGIMAKEGKFGDGPKQFVDKILKSKSKKAINTVNNNLDIKKLTNERIQVSQALGSGTNVFEVPEYLYHVTSADNMSSILNGGLNKSLREQLNGVYLIDSQNFINHYQNVTGSQGKSHDLVTSLFKQATKNRPKGAGLSNQQVCVIKIPTEELLKNGKLRIRTQEDFFKIKGQIATLQKNAAKKVGVRDMWDLANRQILKQNLLDEGMCEADIEKLMKSIEVKLHQGYTLPKAFANNLENTNAIEYIYNQNIDFAKIKGIKHETINLADILSAGSGTEVVDVSKLPAMFGKI